MHTRLTVNCILQCFPDKGDSRVTETDQLFLNLHQKPATKKKIYTNVNISKPLVFTVVPCILMPSKSFIYQLMHNRVALKEY